MIHAAVVRCLDTHCHLLYSSAQRLSVPRRCLGSLRMQERYTHTHAHTRTHTHTLSLSHTHCWPSEVGATFLADAAGATFLADAAGSAAATQRTLARCCSQPISKRTQGFASHGGALHPGAGQQRTAERCILERCSVQDVALLRASCAADPACAVVVGGKRLARSAIASHVRVFAAGWQPAWVPRATLRGALRLTGQVLFLPGAALFADEKSSGKSRLQHLPLPPGSPPSA
jgi:hypothetical protein